MVVLGAGAVSYERGTPVPDVAPGVRLFYERVVQGNLVHKKQPPQLGPLYDPGYIPSVGTYEGGVSYEQDTPVVRGVDYLTSLPGSELQSLTLE